MTKNVKKACAMALIGGTLLQFGGCLSGSGVTQILRDAVVYAGLEFVTDNDGVFDLFEGGDIPAAE